MISDYKVGDIVKINNIVYEIVLDYGILQLKANVGWKDKYVYAIQPLIDILKLDISIEIIGHNPEQLENNNGL